MTRQSLILVLSLAAAAPRLEAQRITASAFDAAARPDVTALAARKSPTLAALLSWFIFPGVGSYYAGNSSHGTRHLLIGIATLAPTIALLATCDSDGFCDFDHDAARLSLTIALAAGFVANEAWSILVAISDAEKANEAAGVSLAPAVLGLSAPAAGPPGIGVRLVRVTF